MASTISSAIKLSVQPNRAYYEPSELVIATVKILDAGQVDAPATAHFKELTFHAAGQERSDPSWIGKLWRPEVKPEAMENRRNVRTIFRTETAKLVAAADAPLAPGAARQFHLRFRLPSNLPPSFKGSSLRFTYTIEVRAVYELRSGKTPGSTFETMATTNLLVWPPHAWPRQGPAGAGPGAGATGELTPRHSGAIGAAPSQQLPPSGFGAAGMNHRDRSSADGSAGGAAPAGPAATSGVPDDMMELPLSDYRLQQTGIKVRVLDAASGSWGSGAALAASSSGAALSLADSAAMNGRAAPASTLTPPATSRSEASLAVSGPGRGLGAPYASPQRGGTSPPGMPMSEAPSFAAWGGGGGSSGGASAGAPTPSRAWGAAGHVGATVSPLRVVPGHARAASAGAGSSGGVFGGATPAAAPSPSPSVGGANDAPSTSRPVTTVTPYAAAAAAAAAAAGLAVGHSSSSASATPHPDASDDSDQEGAGTLGRRSLRPPLLLTTGAYANAKNQQQQQHQQQLQQQYQNQRHLRVSESSSAAGAEPPSPHGSGAGALAHAQLTTGAGPMAWPARSGSIGAPPQVFGKSFVLSASGTPVVKLTLQAPLDGQLQPGNTFGGLLDFRLVPSATTPALRCHQVSVMLETEELISAQHSSRPPGASGRGTGGRIIRVLHCEQQEVTSEAAASHFLFTIPSSATPSFRSPMVSLRWVLRFELVIGPPIDHTAPSDRQAQAGHSGVAAQLQQLAWPLPLVVLAPQAAQL